MSRQCLHLPARLQMRFDGCFGCSNSPSICSDHAFRAYQRSLLVGAAFQETFEGARGSRRKRVDDEAREWWTAGQTVRSSSFADKVMLEEKFINTASQFLVQCCTSAKLLAFLDFPTRLQAPPAFCCTPPPNPLKHFEPKVKICGLKYHGSISSIPNGTLVAILDCKRRPPPGLCIQTISKPQGSINSMAPFELAAIALPRICLSSIQLSSTAGIRSGKIATFKDNTFVLCSSGYQARNLSFKGAAALYYCHGLCSTATG